MKQERKKNILTFGPVSVSPAYQRRGYGKMLMEHSFIKAKDMGYDVIVIFGSPVNYISSGFKSCKKHNISIENEKYPSAMLVKELIPNVLEGHKWVYSHSPVMNISVEEAQKYDDTLEPMEKNFFQAKKNFIL